MKDMRRTTARTTKLRIYHSLSLLPERICVMQTIFEEEILCLTLSKYCQVDKIMESYDANHSINIRLIQTFNIKERRILEAIEKFKCQAWKRGKKERSKEALSFWRQKETLFAPS